MTAIERLEALKLDNAKLPSLRNQHVTVPVWAELAAAFEHGACVEGDVIKCCGQILSYINRAAGDPIAVHLDRTPYGVAGLIVCPNESDTVIVPLTIRENLVTLNNEPIFAGRRMALKPLREKLIDAVIAALQYAT